jgi:hypothetical protein
MFCAKVLIGIPCVQGPDRTLLRPPIMPDTKIAFDSVSGKTKGHDVIMVYSNRKAYPQYLITYM